MNNMRKFFDVLAALTLGAMLLVACGHDSDSAGDSTKPNSVITLSVSDLTFNPEAGGTAKVSITVPRFGWTATQSADWITLTPSSVTTPGTAEMVVKVAANTSVQRTASIEIISGNVSKTINVMQRAVGQGEDPVYNNPDATANIWMYSVLKDMYLWNELVREAVPEYDQNYNTFLDDLLLPLKGNELDGGTTDGKRYIYSNVSREAASRTSGVYPSYGIGRIMFLNKGDGTYLARVLYTNPGAPADKAGIRRGEYIGKVNGNTITTSNYLSYYYSLLYPASGVTLNLTMTDVATDAAGKVTGITDGRTVSVSTANIGNDPVLMSKVINTNGHKVGYFAYTAFERGKSNSSTEYDQEMEQVFADFKAAGITDLVVDLRYNGGGYVTSCTKLCSMIAPTDKLTARMCYFRYNNEREATITQADKDIPFIGSYASKNVNMTTVYVLATENSASASEMVISALRGVDVNVIHIGTTTEGKNVGMEVQYRTIGDFEYTFAPITFQIYNDKGFSDYAEGFTPNYKLDEWDYIGSSSWGNLGSSDELLLGAALTLIDGGTIAQIETRSSIDNHSKLVNVRDQRMGTFGALVDEVE